MSSSNALPTALLALLKAYGLYNKVGKIGEYFATDSGQGQGVPPPSGEPTPTPTSDTPVGEFGESGGATYGSEAGSIPAGEFGELGGGGGLSTEGGTATVEGATAGLGEAGASLGLSGYAMLAAPLVMGWLKYGSGEGDNVPVQKDAQIKNYINEMGNLFKTDQTGADPNTLSQYQQAMSDLYHQAHRLGSGGYYGVSKDQQASLGDQGIDKALASQGLTHDKLQSLLGYYVPDWSKTEQEGGPTGNYLDWYKDQMNTAYDTLSKETGVPVDQILSNPIYPKNYQSSVPERYRGDGGILNTFLKGWDLWSGKPKVNTVTEVKPKSLFGSTIDTMFPNQGA